MKSCNNIDMKVIHCKALELPPNLLSGASTVILILAGQVGTADIQAANQVLYLVSYLCDTNRGEDNTLVKRCSFVGDFNTALQI